MPKHLLIVYHSKTGNTEALAQAAYAGATDDLIDAVDVRLLRARDAGPGDLLWADALLLGTPENFGYMSGAMKDFFDRTFYEVEGRIAALPYAIFISAGASFSIEKRGTASSTSRRSSGLRRKSIRWARGAFPTNCWGSGWRTSWARATFCRKRVSRVRSMPSMSTTSAKR